MLNFTLRENGTQRFLVLTLNKASVALLLSLHGSARAETAAGSEALASVNAEASNNLRETARRELQPPPAQNGNSIPSIMMPLQDNYAPAKERSWLWSLQTSLARQKVLVTKPEDAEGLGNVADLGTLNFLGLKVGAQKEWRGQDWGFHLLGEFSTTATDYNSISGQSYPLHIQWVSYGLAASWGKRWLHWTTQALGTTLSYDFENVIVTQSSAKSSLLQWSQVFIQKGPRLSLDYFYTRGAFVAHAFGRSLDAGEKLSLAAGLAQSSFGTTISWSLAYGVLW
ncbi:MAG: hypothetical protein C5B49_00575 [Bdellovibrio sp.]|nr:MAG: hypothetical protein C5B49_00575 [Bdellovibrio sp.]